MVVWKWNGVLREVRRCWTAWVGLDCALVRDTRVIEFVTVIGGLVGLRVGSEGDKGGWEVNDRLKLMSLDTWLAEVIGGGGGKGGENED